MALQLPYDRTYVWVNRLLLLAVALAGIAHVAFLPPFEGYDEIAHLSYIEQIADTGHIPRLGIDKISTDVEAYPGPWPYRSRPPYDRGGRNYKAFFAGALPSLPQNVERLYQPGTWLNWEAQHPPLYYIVMAPVYLVAQDWNWTDLFLLLRLASWGLAFTGFAIGCRATQAALTRLQVAPVLQLLVPTWPFLFPEFFPEMARLGNDSLCLLLMGLGWHLLLRLLDRREPRTALLLGLILGLGLLTKALFLPITVGTVALLGVAAFRDGGRQYLRSTALVLVAAAVLGGGWYVQNLLSTGSLIGAADLLKVERAGGLWSRIGSTFNIAGFLHGIGGIATSFAWAGTWSYGRLSPLYTLPVLLLAAFPTVDWLAQLRGARLPVIAPVFLAGPIILGLVYHWLTQMTLGGGGNGTPGWYLHILHGPLALALVVGWRRRGILMMLAGYALLFHAACWVMQLSLFSGCAFKAGDYKYVQLGSCLIEPSHLAVLGEPTLGMAALALAVSLGTAAGFIWMMPRRAVAGTAG
jgi:hypothetical protein